ncbi:hypothetical protein [Paraglaciecola psychrophila]|jgi:hypothetical protein|uniref:Uncharacterized protein n=1 Tax=Paraglaciecola psychrophila 170 TaxID=1129794 RepID=K6Z5K4_9ALTE|nr:hypothetical protein [Paraglaciecola psychrophila]AGH44272.1 hypothetical protein C427_2163 [Paraglaciecola psychrophila 170]GAC40339.1 hypothetical protein GPSY_4737 [Paraglaciecola psychrophila 170]
MERQMSKKVGSICLILMLTKSDFTFANEVQVFYFSKSELLHYLLFDAIFIFSVWLFFYLCRIALTRSNKKVSKHFLQYSQRRFETSVKNIKTPTA